MNIWKKKIKPRVKNMDIYLKLLLIKLNPAVFITKG